MDNKITLPASWIDVDDELPQDENEIYFVVTDEGSMGVATYFKDDEKGKYLFDVWWATSGREPKVKYWLKYDKDSMAALWRKWKGLC